MGRTVVEVEGLSKRYWLGSGVSLGRRHRPYQGPISRLLHKDRAPEQMWALRDVSFSVGEGEALGVIGRNGAGKSTLFKLLSRITAPTEGEIRLHGRVGSLLEVGTGFQGDLTGRENVYLSGVILGMSRREITRHFDDIVEFSGLSKFLDTPVKRYSSGMGMRLAFSVASHLTAEILVVDEVLAVGDTEFQAKCLAKMSDVARSGRTVLFVSHNMGAVSNLCERVIVLEQGTVRYDGATAEGLSHYYDSLGSLGRGYEATVTGTRPAVRFVRLHPSQSGAVHDCTAPLTIEVGLHVPRTLRASELSVSFVTVDGLRVARLRSADVHKGMDRPGDYVVRLELPHPRLYMGRYFLDVSFREGPHGPEFDSLRQLCPFEVVMHDIPRDVPWTAGESLYLEDAEWDVQPAEDADPQPLEG